MISKSTKHPTTTGEIRQARAELFVRQRELEEEGAAIYAAVMRGTPPPAPLTDHERRVREHVQKLMNGATPAHLLITQTGSRDEQIRAELDAIKIADRAWAKLEEEARQREAEQYVADHDAEWR